MLKPESIEVTVPVVQVVPADHPVVLPAATVPVDLQAVGTAAMDRVGLLAAPAAMVPADRLAAPAAMVTVDRLAAGTAAMVPVDPLAAPAAMVPAAAADHLVT